MQLISNPIDTCPPLLPDLLATITPVAGTTSSATTTVNQNETLTSDDYPVSRFVNLKTGWQRDTNLYILIPSITFTGTNYGTITVHQVLNGGNVPIAQRSFYSIKSGWLTVKLSLLQYPENATSLSVVTQIALPAGAVVTGACQLFL